MVTEFPCATLDVEMTLVSMVLQYILRTVPYDVSTNFNCTNATTGSNAILSYYKERFFKESWIQVQEQIYTIARAEK